MYCNVLYSIYISKKQLTNNVLLLSCCTVLYSISVKIMHCNVLYFIYVVKCTVKNLPYSIYVIMYNKNNVL